MLIIFLILGFDLVVQAQKVAPLDEVISQKLASGDPAAVEEGQYLQSLVFDLHPALYISGGELKAYGSVSPVVVFCAPGYVDMLYNDDTAFSNVELITINVNSASEIPFAVDLTRLKEFARLRYLLIIFAYDACGEQSENCLTAVMDEIIRGDSSPVDVLYELSIPK